MTATMRGLEDEKSKLMATTKAEKEQLTIESENLSTGWAQKNGPPKGKFVQ